MKRFPSVEKEAYYNYDLLIVNETALFGKTLIRPLLSILLLLLFAFGLGKDAWIPPLRLLQDTPWDLALWPGSLWPKLVAALLFAGTALGLLGWAGLLRRFLMPKAKDAQSLLLSFGVSLGLFSLWAWGLAVNEILYGPLLLLVILPLMANGWHEFRKLDLSFGKLSALGILGAIVILLLWGSEFLSPPLIWDAVLDHFRYARETARLHQVLFHWTNHTGDMPKAAELVLAGFWAMGGEALSKLSLVFPLLTLLSLLVFWVRDEKKESRSVLWVALSCPFFLAIFAWGYVEGFLASFEILALFTFFKSLQKPQKTELYLLTGFFLGFAFAIKTTAVLAFVGLLIPWAFMRGWKKIFLKNYLLMLAGFCVPVLPWYLKDFLAFGDPFYPLAIHWFWGGPGYDGEMEKALLGDTGMPSTLGLLSILKTFWDCFFTTRNGVNAAWTPLWVMALPWMGKVLRARSGLFLGLYAAAYLGTWCWVDQSLRHTSGAAVTLVLLAGLTWSQVFEQKNRTGKMLFVIGTGLSLWLTLVAQFNATAPYAAALGLEDPLLRLKRHYSFDTDTYKAYRGIEEHSDPKDKVLAFAVFQTYPLDRTAFVDFKWKRPVFLEWARESGTAERLAKRLKEEGIEYFLYQEKEAGAMAHVEKDFDLEGMTRKEYLRFWNEFMEPIGVFSNCFVFRPKTNSESRKLIGIPIPGVAEGILNRKP